MRCSTVAARTALGDVGLDLFGIALVGSAAWWGGHVARTTAGDADRLVAFGAAAAGSYLLARGLGQELPWLPLSAVVLGVAYLTVLPIPGAGTYRSGQPFGPLAYANASAALYLLAAVMAAMLLRLNGPSWIRPLGAVAGLGAVVAVAASGSVAAIVLLVLPTTALLVRDPAAARRFVVMTGIAVLATVLITLAFATAPGSTAEAGAEEGRVSRWVTEMLSEERLTYWSEALTLAREHPVTGVGPGRFRHLAPSARGNVDAVAVHNEFLQAAAELGLPGSGLLAALVFWGFIRLAASADSPTAPLAAAGLAAVSIHASIDYVLHAPAVLVSLGVVIASGVGPLRRGTVAHRRSAGG